MSQPPARPPTDPKSKSLAPRDKAATGKDGPGADTAAAQRQGVIAQREHIEGLTGEDPLRGGVAD
ncbi:hypothetical protein CFHF_06500 [Caulobacter flavus]|uniref:Uncharacterized protein n=1 Tax=Caulobacter flavus TaxID=1679497 RepID=A0A2N5CX57_9CAUL|nr:hypothetical protein [Caulobacter flavus]AYV47549.1 hypothetical protein C1707_15500 [Caulobacter flavus]PLR18390.1 hypothetical protein CFHF_06500 [Caulobacter flavus]